MEILEADEANLDVSSNPSLSFELILGVLTLLRLYKSRISCIGGSSGIQNGTFTLMSVHSAK